LFFLFASALHQSGFRQFHALFFYARYTTRVGRKMVKIKVSAKFSPSHSFRTLVQARLTSLGNNVKNFKCHIQMFPVCVIKRIGSQINSIFPIFIPFCNISSLFDNVFKHSLSCVCFLCRLNKLQFAEWNLAHIISSCAALMHSFSGACKRLCDDPWRALVSQNLFFYIYSMFHITMILFLSKDVKR
jgi:hypothetical protein